MKEKMKGNYWRSVSVVLVAGLFATTFFITGCGTKDEGKDEKKEEKKVEEITPGQNGATEEIVTEGLPKDFKELVGRVKEVNKDSITIEADEKSESFKINEDTFIQKEVAEENGKPVEGKIEDIKVGSYVSVVAKGEGVINICLLTEEDFKMFNQAGE